MNRQYRWYRQIQQVMEGSVSYEGNIDRPGVERMYIRNDVNEKILAA